MQNLLTILGAGRALSEIAALSPAVSPVLAGTADRLYRTWISSGTLGTSETVAPATQYWRRSVLRRGALQEVAVSTTLLDRAISAGDQANASAAAERVEQGIRTYHGLLRKRVAETQRRRTASKR